MIDKEIEITSQEAAKEVATTVGLKKETFLKYALGLKIIGCFMLHEYEILSFRETINGTEYILKDKYGCLVPVSEKSMDHFFQDPHRAFC